jgi:hypothetical protein
MDAATGQGGSVEGQIMESSSHIIRHHLSALHAAKTSNQGRTRPEHYASAQVPLRHAGRRMARSYRNPCIPDFQKSKGDAH